MTIVYVIAIIVFSVFAFFSIGYCIARKFNC